MTTKHLAVVAVLYVSAWGVQAQEVNAEAAQAVIKENECSKCHALDKKKTGPSYKETAKKYKGKPDALEKLFKHATSGPKIKVEDKEEKHKIIEAKNDEEIRNVLRWILSRQ